MNRVARGIANWPIARRSALRRIQVRFGSACAQKAASIAVSPIVAQGVTSITMPARMAAGLWFDLGQASPASGERIGVAGAAEHEQQRVTEQRTTMVSRGIPSLRLCATAAHYFACAAPRQRGIARGTRSARRSKIRGAIGCTSIGTPANPGVLWRCAGAATSVCDAGRANACAGLGAIGKAIGRADARPPKWRTLTCNTTSSVAKLPQVLTGVAARAAVLPVRAGVSARCAASATAAGSTCCLDSARDTRATGWAASGSRSRTSTSCVDTSRTSTSCVDTSRANDATGCSCSAVDSATYAGCTIEDFRASGCRGATGCRAACTAAAVSSAAAVGGVIGAAGAANSQKQCAGDQETTIVSHEIPSVRRASHGWATTTSAGVPGRMEPAPNSLRTAQKIRIHDSLRGGWAIPANRGSKPLFRAHNTKSEEVRS